VWLSCVAVSAENVKCASGLLPCAGLTNTMLTSSGDVGDVSCTALFGGVVGRASGPVRGVGSAASMFGAPNGTLPGGISAQRRPGTAGKLEGLLCERFCSVWCRLQAVWPVCATFGSRRAVDER
jgi:hypothetical protein